MKSWAIPAAVIVTIEFAVALTIGASVGFRYSIPFGTYLLTGLTIVGLAASAAIVIRLFTFAGNGEDHPTKRLIAEAPRFSGFAIGVMLVALQIALLTWTKVMLPIAVSFWADPVLADVDHAIFGVDPWQLAYSAFGWSNSLLDRVYVSWAPVKFITLLLLLMQSESMKKARSLISYFLIMASGALGQYLLPSAGPIFYSHLGLGDRFLALPVEPWVRAAEAYLWRDYLAAGGEVGTGISAMPSMHVAIALWVALVWRSYLPRMSLIGLSYFAAITVGSVLLGWHYAVDAVAACLITVAAWVAAWAWLFRVDGTFSAATSPAPVSDARQRASERLVG